MPSKYEKDRKAMYEQCRVARMNVELCEHSLRNMKSDFMRLADAIPRSENELVALRAIHFAKTKAFGTVYGRTPGEVKIKDRMIVLKERVKQLENQITREARKHGTD